MEDEKKEVATSEVGPETNPADIEKGKGGTENPTTESEESETKDKGTEGEGDNGKPKTKQTREEDARYAEMRRQNEKLQREIEEYRKRDIERVSDKALNDLNLKREDLNDEDNARLVKAYEKAVAEGVENPVGYAYRSEYARSQEAKKKSAEEGANIRKDIEDFKKMYGSKVYNEIMEPESAFQKKLGKKLRPGNLCDLYDTYMLTIGEEPKAAKPTEIDKAKSTAPSGKSGSSMKPADLKAMSDEEYQRWFSTRNDRYTH